VKKKLNMIKLGMISTALATRYNLYGIEVWFDVDKEPCEVEIYSNYVLVSRIVIYDKTLCSLLSV